MQGDKFTPSERQVRFLEEHLLGEEATILTLKVVGSDRRGFSVNVRGPFKLARYNFSHHSETVIDAEWAGTQESNSHMHCCWPEVRFAKLTATNQAVQKNIGYKWQLSFYASEEDAKQNRPLFWFYLETDNHKAVKKLKAGQLLAVS